MFRKIRIAAATAAGLALIMGFTAVAAANGNTGTDAASGGSSSVQKSGRQSHRFGKTPGGAESFGDTAAMRLLAELDSTTAEALEAKYPQQTVWQIAEAEGKLDALKHKAAAEYQTLLKKLLEKKEITSSECAQLLADMNVRLAKINGTSIVILGQTQVSAAGTVHGQPHAFRRRAGGNSSGSLSSSPSSSGTAAGD